MVEERDLEFLQAYWERPAVVTYVLFGINILIFILMELAGGATNDYTLMAFGIKSNPEINNGEYWRLVTPVFIHIGLLHLVFNSYAIWVVGPQVEKLYGGARFTILYLVSGIAGVLGSYFIHKDVRSAGASGAIFGLFGVLLVFGFKYRNSIPAMFRKAVGKGVILVIAVNLVIGFQLPGIDNSAHISGLLGGALLAVVVPYQSPGSTTSSLFKILQAVFVLAVIVCFIQVVAHYNGPGISLRNLYQIVE